MVFDLNAENKKSSSIDFLQNLKTEFTNHYHGNKLIPSPFLGELQPLFIAMVCVYVCVFVCVCVVHVFMCMGVYWGQ